MRRVLIVGPALALLGRSYAGLTRTRPTEAGTGGIQLPPARLVGVLALGVALLAIRPAPVDAQPELQMWLNPEMGKQIPRADYRYTFYPERKVEDQDTHFAMTEQQITLFTPLYQDSRDEWAFAAKTLYQDIDTHAQFPQGGRCVSERALGRERRAQLSTQVRQQLDRGTGADGRLRERRALQ
jgi:hypothetical protein